MQQIRAEQRPAAVLRARAWGWDVKARRSLAHVVLADGAGRCWGSAGEGASWIAAINRGTGGEAIAYGVTAARQVCELGGRPWPR